MAAPSDINALPLVLHDEHLCELLGISARTLRKLRRLRALPIPELPTLDKRHRYSRADVEAFLNREGSARLARRRA